jgi:hypothetical protein
VSEREDRRQALREALARLQEALTAAGDPPLQPATSDVLEDVHAALTPWRLPAEVEEFWRLVDGDSAAMTSLPFPQPAGARLALDTWRENGSQPGSTPPLLFPVCYQSWVFVLVELDGPDGAGGACFRWSYDGEPFTLVARDLATYLDVAAAEVGADEPTFAEALRERLRTDPHPRYGAALEVATRAEQWPAHWLESAGPSAGDQHPLGATTTVTALASAGTGAAGRVHAEVTSLMGTSTGLRVVIDDGTGDLPVWCPSAVTLFGPTYGDGKRYEFDLVTTDDAPHGAHAEAVAVRLLS